MSKNKVSKEDREIKRHRHHIYTRNELKKKRSKYLSKEEYKRIDAMTSDFTGANSTIVID